MYFQTLISIKYYCIFSIYKVIDLNIKKSPYPSNKIFNLNIKISLMSHLNLLDIIRYQPSKFFMSSFLN